ncbi:metalloregulator ArsR/SmtB family transcription factor [Candidatus Woesearchaeota archaeon]|nr:metalloregulator ArsR/SmtB family transcription factor [Candidatus Woesearchaeota archaeon]MBW3016319.1 metalloregulator ArsR/SmtB family transcription factor [Candidatus Woesearchaeota archaeon]
MDIRLDKETFKALASSTRVDVLKLLGQRRYMQSEIASVLELSVPTVKEHLSALEKAGLVERHDEGRKWKYYSLTKKGKGVLNPEEMKIWIVLVLFLFSVVGGFVSYLRHFEAPVVKTEMLMRAPAAESYGAVADVAVQQPTNYWFIVFLVFAILFALMLIYLIYKSVNYKRMLGKSLIKK